MMLLLPCRFFSYAADMFSILRFFIPCLSLTCLRYGAFAIAYAHIFTCCYAAICCHLLSLCLRFMLRFAADADICPLTLPPRYAPALIKRQFFASAAAPLFVRP